MGLKRPTVQLIEKYRRQFEHKNSAEEEAIILKAFVVFYDLGNVNARELDYFLWGYGKEIFG